MLVMAVEALNNARNSLPDEAFRERTVMDRLNVGVLVNETWSDNEPCGINNAASLTGRDAIPCHPDNSIPPHSNVAVKPLTTRAVDYVASLNDEVILRSRRTRLAPGQQYRADNQQC